MNEILLSIIIGVTTGIIASWLFTKTIERGKKKRNNKIYGPIAGIYLRKISNEKVIAKATTKHLKGENRITIEVITLTNEKTGREYNEEEIEIWEGEAIMDTSKSGTVIWEQKKPLNGNNGFKRIIIDEDLNTLTLIGEQDFGYGVEKFTEKVKNATNKA